MIGPLSRHPERSEGPSHPGFELDPARSLAPLGMTGVLAMTDDWIRYDG
jgi:hypothetical protein